MIKSLLISTLSAIAVSVLASPASAEEVMAFNQTIPLNAPEFSPFSLVAAGYQGRLIKQGIPADDAFLTAIRSNKIEARDLVKSAIASGQLSTDILNNQDYLDSVALLLNDLEI